MGKMTKRVSILFLGAVLLNVIDARAAEPAALDGVAVRLARNFGNEVFARIAARIEGDIGLTQTQITDLQQRPVVVTAAKTALDQEFRGFVAADGKILKVPTQNVDNFIALKAQVDKEEALVEADRAILESLLAGVQDNQRMFTFCRRAPRVLDFLGRLSGTVLSKRDVYGAAMGQFNQQPQFQPQVFQPRVFGRGQLLRDLVDQPLLDFVAAVGPNGNIIIKSGNADIEKLSCMGVNADFIKGQIAAILGAAGTVQEFNDWLAAFPQFVVDTQTAYQAIKNQVKASTAKLQALRNGPVDIAELGNATTELRTFRKISDEKAEEVTVFTAVKIWLDDMAEHLRKKGLVS